MTTHSIRKGFDIPMAGKPETRLETAAEPSLVAVETGEFPGIKPKMLVKEGDRVQTGQPLFFDKTDPEIFYVSPATGVVFDVNRGPRRFLRRVVIERLGEDSFATPARVDPDQIATMERSDLITALKKSGLWPLLRRRPLGTMPRPYRVPVAIYINGMDTEPLAADPAFAVQGQGADLQLGIDGLQRLTDGAVYLTVRAGAEFPDEFRRLRGVEVHEFRGPHPAGLVGTHISRIAPLSGDQVAWYLKAQEAALIGHWLRTGQYPSHRVVALAGPRAPVRCYFRVRQGAALMPLIGGWPDGDVRIIRGTVLTGTVAEPTSYIGFSTWTVTVMDEGSGRRDLLGWLLPKFGRLSASRAVWSWLGPKREYDLDARLNGGPRAIVNIGSMESVTPLDIHPTYLVRAIQAGDLEEALNLGLLDVTEEDVALCTFVDPSKLDVGQVIRQGHDLYEAEG